MSRQIGAQARPVQRVALSPGLQIRTRPPATRFHPQPAPQQSTDKRRIRFLSFRSLPLLLHLILPLPLLSQGDRELRRAGTNLAPWKEEEERERGEKGETCIVLFKWMGNDSVGFADNYMVGFNQFGPFTVWRGLILQYKGSGHRGAVPEKAPAWCK